MTCCVNINMCQMAMTNVQDFPNPREIPAYHRVPVITEHLTQAGQSQESCCASETLAFISSFLNHENNETFAVPWHLRHVRRVYKEAVRIHVSAWCDGALWHPSTHLWLFYSCCLYCWQVRKKITYFLFFIIWFIYFAFIIIGSENHTTW